MIRVISPTHAWRVAFALIGIDLKQGLRKHVAGSTPRDWAIKGGGLLFGLGFFAMLHIGAYSLIRFTQRSPSEHPAQLFLGLSCALWAFLLFVMLSGGLVRAIVVLHEQDDSSLLLSSPVSPRAVLAARLFGNALQSCLVDGFIIVPYLDVLVIAQHQWRYLCGYAIWFILAVIVTCLDGLFSFGLIRRFGLRRARALSQAVPFVLIFGVTFFAGSLSVSIARMNAHSDSMHMSRSMQDRFIALTHTPLAGLARAASGDPLWMAVTLIATIGLAWLTLWLTERAFIEGTQELAENACSARPSRDRPFGSNLLLLEIRKSLRLVVRTPMMIVQCLAQVLTPVGIAFILGSEDLASAAVFFTVFAAGVLSGILTIAAATVEEADDLLRMSPRRYLLFRLGKMLSGGAVPVAVTILAGLGLGIAGKLLAAVGLMAAAIPLSLTTSIVGESFAHPVPPGVRPKLLSDPLMMVPLLGMQIVSGAVAGLVTFAVLYSASILALCLLASYAVFAVMIGLVQLRKSLF